MNKKTSAVMKGIGIGMIAGGATAVAGGMMMGSHSGHKYRKMANKAAKTAGDIMDSISHSIGM